MGRGRYLRHQRWTGFHIRNCFRCSRRYFWKSHVVLIAGLAGMIASAPSMGSDAYLAAKNEREIYEAAFAREKDSVEHNESEARDILSLTYQVRGFPAEDVYLTTVGI